MKNDVIESRARVVDSSRIVQFIFGALIIVDNSGNTMRSSKLSDADRGGISWSTWSTSTEQLSWAAGHSKRRVK